MPTWSVLLICNQRGDKSEMMVYIVQAVSEDIARSLCILAAIQEDDCRTFAQVFATELDMTRPHKILQG